MVYNTGDFADFKPSATACYFSSRREIGICGDGHQHKSVANKEENCEHIHEIVVGVFHKIQVN